MASVDDKPAPTNLDRLKEEASNPFRTLRLFLYGAAGANAAIGGFTALTQLAGTLGEAPNAMPLDQVLQNIGVDFGVVAFAAALYKFETDSREIEIDSQVEGEARAKTKLSKDAMKEREEMLGSLTVSVVTGEGGDMRAAPVSEIQSAARQNLVIVAGKKPVLKEALVKAMIMGDRFAAQNVLVVPVPLDSDGETGGSGSKGFAKSSWEDKPYVAKAGAEGSGGADWERYVGMEIEAAAAQAKMSVAEIKSQGIVIVADRQGKIVRRGLGAPEWGMVIEDLKPKEAK
eukprot:CAMPEP_0172616132 /NCGR_PEP_ID=MMETSP1068-20121228/62728_1 /TAXON_ID=35684 /ORGANISM="Pseudopedinella elastica, Strain CCMP716" /LENGTH=286 /DNA_ID=CAMNT_0013421469 /DNA_START=153 /DNA_END=1013 /DNA_ORIENTATION=+